MRVVKTRTEKRKAVSTMAGLNSSAQRQAKRALSSRLAVLHRIQAHCDTETTVSAEHTHTHVTFTHAQQAHAHWPLARTRTPAHAHAHVYTRTRTLTSKNTHKHKHKHGVTHTCARGSKWNTVVA